MIWLRDDARNCPDLMSSFSHIMPIHISNFHLEKGQNMYLLRFEAQMSSAGSGLCTFGDGTSPRETKSKNLIFPFFPLDLGRYWSWN